jgi:RNA recognition motif. (a.k.a. RRM, RBD, or RNP domain)
MFLLLSSVMLLSVGSPGGYDMSGRHSNPIGRMQYRHSPQQGPSSPSDDSHPDSLAENLQHLSFSSPDKRTRAATAKRKFKKPCPEELEEARQRTIYVSDLNKGITETELVRWFGVAGHVLECRICSDMNTSKRFAFVEFADKAGFEQGTLNSDDLPLPLLDIAFGPRDRSPGYTE